jgi:hypothetical protein
MSCRTLALAGLIALTAPPAADAALVIGNLPATNDAAASTLSAGQFKAMAFTIVAFADLDSAVLRLRFDSDTAPVLTLNADAGGRPGSTLVTFTSPAFPSGSVQQVTYTPVTPFTLVGGTTYWLTLTGRGSGFTTWVASIPPITPIGDIAGHAGSSLNGAVSDRLNSYQVNSKATASAAVPAPPTLLLGVVGAGLIGLTRRGA